MEPYVKRKKKCPYISYITSGEQGERGKVQNREDPDISYLNSKAAIKGFGLGLRKASKKIQKSKSGPENPNSVPENQNSGPENPDSGPEPPNSGPEKPGQKPGQKSGQKSGKIWSKSWPKIP